MARLPALPVRELAAATPPSRDRVIDGLRAMSLSIVVFGHCFMALVLWQHGVPKLGNSLALHRSLQYLTWLLQIMPLFFFAGGASNAITWRAKRADGYGSWLWGRGARLIRPLWVYLAVMAPAALLVARLTPNRVAAPLLLLTTQLLWFLGAYLIVTALGPVLWRAHQRQPLMALALLAATAVLVDLGRFAWHGPSALGLINFVVVWSFASQLGLWYVERPIAPRHAVIVAAVALGLNTAIVHLCSYPISMVGMPGDKFSNMAPPTVPLLVHALVVCMVATAMRGPLSRLFSRSGPWRFAVLINAVAMTLYLWHLPMLIVLFVLEHASGLGAHAVLSHGVIAAGPHYWFWWPVHFLIFLALVAGAVRCLWWLENTPLPLWDAASRLPEVPRRLVGVINGVGVAITGAALLVFSATGLGGFPTRVVHYAGLPLSSGLALILLLLGATALRWASAPRKATLNTPPV